MVDFFLLLCLLPVACWLTTSGWQRHLQPMYGSHDIGLLEGNLYATMYSPTEAQPLPRERSFFFCPFPHQQPNHHHHTSVLTAFLPFETYSIASLQVCRYGLGCYRRNPLHAEQFAHPHRGQLFAPSSFTSGLSSKQRELLLAHVSIPDVRKVQVRKKNI